MHIDQGDRDVDAVGRHACSQREALKGAIALLIELLSDLGIGILIEQTIDGCQRRMAPSSATGQTVEEGHVDGLRCTSLEANMRDNLICFVNGHIFNQEAHHTFSLAHGGLGIMPELTKAFRDLAVSSRSCAVTWC